MQKFILLLSLGLWCSFALASDSELTANGGSRLCATGVMARAVSAFHRSHYGRSRELFQFLFSDFEPAKTHPDAFQDFTWLVTRNLWEPNLSENVVDFPLANLMATGLITMGQKKEIRAAVNPWLQYQRNNFLVERAEVSDLVAKLGIPDFDAYTCGHYLTLPTLRNFKRVVDQIRNEGWLRPIHRMITQVGDEDSPRDKVDELARAFGGGAGFSVASRKLFRDAVVRTWSDGVFPDQFSAFQETLLGNIAGKIISAKVQRRILGRSLAPGQLMAVGLTPLSSAEQVFYGLPPQAMPFNLLGIKELLAAKDAVARGFQVVALGHGAVSSLFSQGEGVADHVFFDPKTREFVVMEVMNDFEGLQVATVSEGLERIRKTHNAILRYFDDATVPTRWELNVSGDALPTQRYVLGPASVLMEIVNGQTIQANKGGRPLYVSFNSKRGEYTPVTRESVLTPLPQN